MASFILFLAVMCAGAAFMLSYAGYIVAYGVPWISDVCWSVPVLCNNPELAMYAAAGLTGIWAVVKTASIMRS